MQINFDSGRTIWVIMAITIFNYMFDYTSNVEFEYTKMYQRLAVGGGEDQLICADSVARVTPETGTARVSDCCFAATGSS